MSVQHGEGRAAREALQAAADAAEQAAFGDARRRVFRQVQVQDEVGVGEGNSVAVGGGAHRLPGEQRARHLAHSVTALVLHHGLGRQVRVGDGGDTDVARAVAALAGRAARVADAARRAADGDLRLAAHLAEMAVQADPQDAALHEARAEVYAARAAAEPSLMATGVFKWAADESRRAVGGEAAPSTIPGLIA